MGAASSLLIPDWKVQSVWSGGMLVGRWGGHAKWSTDAQLSTECRVEVKGGEGKACLHGVRWVVVRSLLSRCPRSTLFHGQWLTRLGRPVSSSVLNVHHA